MTTALGVSPNEQKMGTTARILRRPSKTFFASIVLQPRLRRKKVVGGGFAAVCRASWRLLNPVAAWRGSALIRTVPRSIVASGCYS